MQITSAYLFRVALLFVLPALAASAGHGPTTERPLELILLREAKGTCDVLTLRDTQKLRGLPAGSVHTSKLQTHAQPQSREERISLVSYDERALWAAAQAECSNIIAPEHAAQALRQDALAAPRATHSDYLGGHAPPLQVEPLIQSGDSSNRVDLVFFADGYTADEHAKFVADALRLAEDVSYNQTFNTVKPLLNFWAAFTPSKESGIGVGGKPKDTAFGLYRDGTELRGVYYSKPDAARAACLSLGDACDYPILMGNDPLYGGLGGEFTVITPSLANGPLVLRHELGHSIIEVGEEYDGGFAYFGVNAAQGLSAPWAHWLTPTSPAPPAARSERAVMPLQDYAWTMLNASAPWTTTFNASGRYARHLVRFSLSGLPEAADLSVRLDGADLGWAPRTDIGVDRWHYDVHRAGGLEDGPHEVSFTLENKKREGVAQMCSVEILEFGDESQFNATPGHYSMYPTFSLNNQTTYRPTNEDCLMRQVTTPNFCKVCVEGLWMSLLRRVDLVDELSTACKPRRNSPRVDFTADLALVPLAQFREGAGDRSAAPQESYTILWTKDGTPLHHFTNQTRLAINGEDADAVYSVDITFATEEVRVDKDGLLTAHRDIALSEIC